MVLITKIECVKKENDGITGIFGTICSDVSGKDPKQGLVLASKIDIAIYRHPQHGDLPIKFIKAGRGSGEKLVEPKTNCFFLVDPDNPSHNLLDDFDECSS